MSTIQVPFDPETQPATGFGPGPLPEGYYHLRCVKQEYVAPKGPDSSAAINVYWEVIASETGEGVGRERRNRFTLSPKAASAFLRPYLQAAGVRYEEIAHPSGQKAISFDPEHLLGTVVRAKTYHSKPNEKGDVYNEWADFSVSQQAQGGGAYRQPAPQMAMPAPQGALPPPGAQYGMQPPQHQAPQFPQGGPPQGYHPQQLVTQPQQQHPQPAWQPPQQAQQGYPQQPPPGTPPWNGQR